eukprot:Gb_32426 [translate_table: standard]
MCLRRMAHLDYYLAAYSLFSGVCSIHLDNQGDGLFASGWDCNVQLVRVWLPFTWLLPTKFGSHGGGFSLEPALEVIVLCGGIPKLRAYLVIVVARFWFPLWCLAWYP